MVGKSLAIVTGGSRGIGHFLVQSSLDDMDVLNISRRPAFVGSSRHELYNLELDLEDGDAVDGVLGTWLAEHPSYCVKLLIHNAATLNLGWLDQVSSEETRQSFQINVLAPLAITSAIFKRARFSEQDCRVVYVISSLGRPLSALSFAGIGLYSASKAALSRLALIQAREFELSAPHIKVLRIHPGIVDTDMQQDLRHSQRVDAAFSNKTAGLPAYVEGDWQLRAPAEHPRTISPSFAAEFIMWAARSSQPEPEEYDFYTSKEFHAARSRS